VATTKLLAGLNEGRGMKEAGKDFYCPGGRWVTSYRVLRFFPCGSLFSYLCASHTPAEVRKAAQAVNPDWPRSLHQRLKGACWGSYDSHETPPHGEHQPGRIGITARVLLFNENYPNMSPATVRYVIELRAPEQPRRRGGLANNSELHVTAIAIENTSGELQSLPAPSNAFVFVPFEGPLPPMPQRPTVPLASGQ